MMQDDTYTYYDGTQHYGGNQRIYPGWNSNTGTPTMPTQVIREDTTDGYNETLTMTAARGTADRDAAKVK